MKHLVTPWIISVKSGDSRVALRMRMRDTYKYARSEAGAGELEEPNPNQLVTSTYNLASHYI